MTKVESFKNLIDSNELESYEKHFSRAQLKACIKLIMNWQKEHGFHLPAHKKVKKYMVLLAYRNAEILEWCLTDPLEASVLEDRMIEEGYI